MKKLFGKVILVAVCILSLTLFAHSNVNELNITSIETEYDCKWDQCHATAASTGQRCKHCVSNEGDLYCWQHK
jgi:hypothetical protein